MLLAALRNWRRRRVLRRGRLDDERFQRVMAHVPAAAHLDSGERRRLRDLATIFLHEKYLEPVHGLALGDDMRMRIAGEAVIPVLNLGLSLYDDWYTVIVYPDEFVSPHEYVDDAGVQHAVRDIRSGESWERGPVVLSWQDIAGAGEDGSVIIHEMAHKLDQQDGSSNGCPPLHRGMDRRRWTGVFSQAYEELCRAVDADEDTWIDPYGAEDPGEFFAVVSEAFFTTPHLLQETWPELYRQLALYYRQDPARRSTRH